MSTLKDVKRNFARLETRLIPALVSLASLATTGFSLICSTSNHHQKLYQAFSMEYQRTMYSTLSSSQ